MRITPKNVRDAADLIESAPQLAQNDYELYDWPEEDEYDFDEVKPFCWCMMGAIAHVKGSTGDELFQDNAGEVTFLNLGFRSAVVEVLPDPLPSENEKSPSSIAHDRVARWNDTKGRTKEEAAAKLREIAERMEKR